MSREVEDLRDMGGKTDQNILKEFSLKVIKISKTEKGKEKYFSGTCCTQGSRASPHGSALVTAFPELSLHFSWSQGISSVRKSSPREESLQG